MAEQGRTRIVWPWAFLSARDMIGIAICLVFVIGVLFASVWRPYLMGLPFFGSTGFGPDWECSRPPNTEPVCVKRIPPRPAQIQ